MDGAQGEAAPQKPKMMGGESSGEDGALQIDEGAVKTAKTGKNGKNGKKTGKKQAEGAKTETKESWTVGDLVWAKVSGFVHWPAKVFDPSHHLIPDYLREPPKPNYNLVRFLGTYDIQWASCRQIESYEIGKKKKLHTKSRSKLFAKALAEAKEFLESGKLPKGMEERPPTSSDDDEEEEEEEVSEEEKAPAKVGSKRKSTASRKEGSRQRKVKIVAETECGSDSNQTKEEEEEEEEKKPDVDDAKKKKKKT